MIVVLGQEIAHLDARLSELGRQLAALHRANPVSRLLAEGPGIGPIGALTLALTIDAKAFRSGRHPCSSQGQALAAWIGLTPKEHATGGKHRLGAISREGNERLRQLLVLGATSVIKVAHPRVEPAGERPTGHRCATARLTGLLERRPRRVVAVAPCSSQGQVWPTRWPASCGP